MKSLIALLAFGLFSVSALAALPPGHPSADTSAEMLNGPKEVPDNQLPQKGKVVSFINTDQYTYIEVKQQDKKETVWLASTTIAVKKGNNIRFDNGFEMKNFYSKTLKRTFPKVLFVSQVVVVK